MNSEQLFAAALGLPSPWNIKEVKLIESETKDKNKELHIYIEYQKGSLFPDHTGQLCKIYDSANRIWRHLNFFQHKCFIHCKLPRIKGSDGKVKTIEVPWARAGSGFTLLFEAFVMSLIESESPINKIAKVVQEDPHRIWTIFNYWTEKAVSNNDISSVTNLGIDETSKKKGHNYITTAVDLDEKKVINIVDGKDKNAVKQIKDNLEAKGVKAEQIEHASIDLSKSFISGISECFPKAQIHFDRFHVVQLLNKAMNEVRIQERKEHKELKGHKYTFLKNKNSLSDEKINKLSELITLFPTLGEAYRLKELFNDLWEMNTAEEADSFIDIWLKEVESKNIPAFNKFATTVKIHRKGIINYVETKINNGILESINAKIQQAKRRAKGYRNLNNFKNMIYFLCGKLDFGLPRFST